MSKAMRISVSTDVLDQEERAFLRASFPDDMEVRIIVNGGHKQLDELSHTVPLLIQFALSAVISGATWDVMKQSVLYLFRNYPGKHEKPIIVKFTKEQQILTLSEGKLVIDTTSKHVVIEGATEELVDKAFQRTE